MPTSIGPSRSRAQYQATWGVLVDNHRDAGLSNTQYRDRATPLWDTYPTSKHIQDNRASLLHVGANTGLATWEQATQFAVRDLKAAPCAIMRGLRCSADGPEGDAACAKSTPLPSPSHVYRSTGLDPSAVWWAEKPHDSVRYANSRQPIGIARLGKPSSVASRLYVPSGKPFQLPISEGWAPFPGNWGQMSRLFRKSAHLNGPRPTENRCPGFRKGFANSQGLLRIYPGHRGTLRVHIHRAQGDGIAQKREINLKFPIDRGRR